MLSKIVLCINSKQATAGLWRMGKLVKCSHYLNDQAGLAKFRLFITSQKNAPIHIIVDAVEEDYRVDTIPHTGGKTREEMLQRKLTQTYRNAPYRTAQVIGRETDKRRDDRILMMALTNADILTPWLNLLEEMESPLAGAYMMPVVSHMVVKALKLKHPNMLLMTRHSTGLRQSYLADQKPRLSRVTPVTNLEESQINKLFLTETEKTRLYLISLRMIARETPINLVYAACSETAPVLVEQLEEIEGISAQILPLQDLSKKFGLKVEQLSRYPELLHMQALARNMIGNNLLPEPLIKSYRLLQLSFGLNVSSIAIFGLGVLLAVGSLFSTIGIKQQTQDAMTQTISLQQRYAEATKSFPKTPVSGTDLKIAVELAQKLDDQSVIPKRFMAVISEEIEKQPAIEITRIRWRHTEEAKFKDTIPGGRTTTAEKGKFEKVPPPPSNKLYELGFIDGEIKNFSGDYRSALENVDLLLENLRKNKEVAQANPTLLPVNTSSQTILQGSTLDQQNLQKETAAFQIKIFLKPETKKMVSQPSSPKQVKP